MDNEGGAGSRTQLKVIARGETHDNKTQGRTETLDPKMM